METASLVAQKERTQLIIKHGSPVSVICNEATADAHFLV